jgi:hypothetical protein
MEEKGKLASGFVDRWWKKCYLIPIERYSLRR